MSKRIIGICKNCWTELYEDERILKSSHKKDYPHSGDDLFCLDCAETLRIEGILTSIPYIGDKHVS